MNKAIKILLLLIVYVTIACDDSKKKPKIAIAGLVHFHLLKHMRRILNQGLVIMFLLIIHFYQKILLIGKEQTGYLH